MVAPALIGALVGGAYGGLTYKSDKAAADRQRQTQALIESQSPWTHMHGRSDTPDPSLLGNIEGGALTGMTYGAKNFKNDGAAPAGETPQTMSASGNQLDAESVAQPPEVSPKNYVEQSYQNPPVKAYDYSNPNAVGYSPWNDLSVNPNKRPAYIPPGEEAQAKPKKSAHMMSPWVNPNYA